MKFLLFLPLAALLGLTCSCRTVCPLNPMTMKPDCSPCGCEESVTIYGGK